MLVLIVEPEKTPVVKEISDSLKAMQEIVGGPIQVVYPFDDQVVLVCNEEGLLSPNRALRDEDGEPYDVICGTFFLCGAPEDSNDFSGLTSGQIRRFERVFHTPEIFVGMDGCIVCMAME